jgi:hypothetical protein
MSLIANCFLPCALIATQTLPGQQITMAGRPYLLLPASPRSVITADFNHDGRTDIAITDGAVTVILQAADGSFQQPVSYTVGDLPQYIAKGDFNHDGSIDLAVTAAANVWVLLGNGDGTFRPAVSYALPTTANGLAVADLNRDGRLDLVVLSSSTSTSSSLTVLRGNGDGTFKPGYTRVIDGSNFGSSLQMTDLNRDGKWDVVFLGIDTFTRGSISIALGNGDGTFAPVTHYSAGSQPISLAVDDFNGDGLLDLVAVDHYNGFIFLGNGDGTFQPQSVISGVGVPDFIRSADFNGDGKKDLAVFDAYDQQVLILADNGDGTFRSLSTTPTGPECCSGADVPMALADLNADYHVDIVVASQGSVMVLSGHGDGTFETEAFLNPGQQVNQLLAGDVNQDGKVDFVVLGTGQVLGLLGNGTGTFQPPSLSPLPGPIDSLILGQFNIGTKLDLAGIDNTNRTADVLLGNGKGYFGQPKVTPLPDAGSLTFRADFNGDGITDVVVGGYFTAPYLLLGKGDGTFTPSTPLSTPGNVLAVRDFNGDGHADILLDTSQFPKGSVAVLLGTGVGTFRSPVTSGLAFPLNAAAVGDFNRDGKLDLAVVFQNGVLPPAVLLGNGDGTFANPQPFSLPNAVVTGMQAVDLNADGKLDLVVALFNLSTVVLLPGDGHAHFGAPSVYGVSGGMPTSLIVTDLNGDGKPDIATNNGSGISILMQTNPGSPIN